MRDMTGIRMKACQLHSVIFWAEKNPIGNMLEMSEFAFENTKLNNTLRHKVVLLSLPPSYPLYFLFHIPFSSHFPIQTRTCT